MKLQTICKVSVLSVAVSMGAYSSKVEAADADCGEAGQITVSEMSWASAGMLAYLTRIVLEEGYRCDIRIIPGDTVPSAATMRDRGEPHIAPELWINLVPDVWQQIEEKGNYIAVADTYRDGVEEGFWIPDYLAEANPELRSIEDLSDHWELFTEPASPDKGRFYGCPPGWGCEIIVPQFFKALDLEENFTLFSPGSGGAMSANIARLVERGLPIVSYYWSPTDIVGRYNLVRLDMPPHDPARWGCLTDPDCEDPQVTGWKPGIVKVVVIERLAETAPAVVEYLGKQSLPNEVVNEMLAWGDETRASVEEMAVQFLREYPHVWREWVPSEVAERVAHRL